MWPLENTASLCRTLTLFLISVSNNMLTFQRRSKCSSADQQQGEMWGVTDCNFTVNTKAARAWQCHLRGEESFNETRLTRPEVTHGAHVMSGRVVTAGLWDGRRLHTLRQTHIKPVEDVRMSVMIPVVLFLFPDIFSLYADDSLFFLTVLCLFVVTLRLIVAALCLHVVIF